MRLPPDAVTANTAVPPTQTDWLGGETELIDVDGFTVTAVVAFELQDPLLTVTV